MRKHHRGWLLLAVLALSACGQVHAPLPGPRVGAAVEAREADDEAFRAVQSRLSSIGERFGSRANTNKDSYLDVDEFEKALAQSPAGTDSWQLLSNHSISFHPHLIPNSMGWKVLRSRVIDVISSEQEVGEFLFGVAVFHREADVDRDGLVSQSEFSARRQGIRLSYDFPWDAYGLKGRSGISREALRTKYLELVEAYWTAPTP